MRRRGWLIYASDREAAIRGIREASLASPGSLTACFSPVEIDGIGDFFRVRSTIHPPADLAACRVAYPGVDWQVHGDLPRPPASLTLPSPRDGEGDVEVLSLLGRFPTWVECRGARQRDFLAAAGITHGWTHARDYDGVSAEIERRRPRVVLNEVWTVSLADHALLARRWPAVQFVALSHAVPGWIATERPAEHYAFLTLARERPNCHYGTVMPADRVVAPRGTRIVSLPNFATMPEGLPAREDGPPTVSLIARDTECKQWGAAVAAVAVAARSIPDLHVVVGSPKLRGGIVPHLRYLDELGVPHVSLDWSTWGGYIDRVARSVDCHLTATIAESFCLIPLEHCLLGRPVAGTPAVEWLPPKWQRNPQDPAALAGCLVSHFREYDAAAGKARAIAERVAAKNHRQLLASLRSLIDA